MPETFPKFDGLNVSSKFAICGLPIRLDTYKTCSFGCQYCFANGRKVMEFRKNLQVANVAQIERVLENVRSGNYPKHRLLETLVSCGITWHCGGMSDPFQPINRELRITNEVINICNKHDVSILFSTKGDDVHGADIRPDLHSFQLSVTNVEDRRDIEPGVPSIESRIRFFKELKAAGFKVGIRIQPFIPGISDARILEAFPDADHFTIEGLKIVPQNREQIEYVRDVLHIPISAFVNNGLFTLKDEYRRHLYKPVVEWLETHGKSYSISDNDMRWMGNNKCCCGDALVRKATGFDTTAVLNGGCIVGNPVYEKCKGCNCQHLFTSNRIDFGKTVEEFFRAKVNSKAHPASKRFQVSRNEQMELFPIEETVEFLEGAI